MIDIKADPCLLESIRKQFMILIDNRLWGGVVLDSPDRDRGAMFIGAADKGHVIVEHAEHPDIDIGGKICPGEVTDVERAIGIRQCRCHEISLGGMDHNLCNRSAKVGKKQRAKSREHRERRAQKIVPGTHTSCKDDA